MKTISLYLMATLYVAAGIYHFVNPAIYVAIMPPWLSHREALVAISGICEIVLGLLLFFSATRRFAAWGIIALLVAVFPANIQMMLNFIHDKNPMTWVAIVRLPIQLLLIWWAYGFARKSS